MYTVQARRALLFQCLRIQEMPHIVAILCRSQPEYTAFGVGGDFILQLIRTQSHALLQDWRWNVLPGG